MTPIEATTLPRLARRVRRRIDIALDYRPDALVLTVSDDGIGIDEEVATAGREGALGPVRNARTR